MNPSNLVGVVSVVLLSAWASDALAQIESSSTGSLRGVRIDGELMAFQSHVRAIAPDAPPNEPIAWGRGEGRYTHDDGGAVVTSGDLAGAERGRNVGTYRVRYKEVSPGVVEAEAQLKATADVPLRGVYFAVTLPASDYAGGSVRLDQPDGPRVTQSLTPSFHLNGSAKVVRVDAQPRRRFELTVREPHEMTVQADPKRNGGAIEIAFPLAQGDLAAGQEVRSTFTIKVAGEVDHSPVKLVIDPAHPGQPFDGVGGNFRIQSAADGAHIRYNLDHLRVAWGRVAMPLDRWHPDENADPVADADAGRLDGRVRAAMEMAQTLARRKIPFMIAVWSAPRWALGTGDGKASGDKRLAPEKRDALFRSIVSYVAYMKDHFGGAEPALFSFNESDIGIDVLQSPEEHADTIRRLGAAFAASGLRTKMVLGDTGNPTATKFIDAALADPAARPFIGAVAFHSWWGGTPGQYARWDEAARQLDVPLIVAEGGTDPHAWRARHVFAEPWYGLEEIAQYVEICRLAQPRSILHWQLTADFGVLSGGGGDGGRDGGTSLQPAQRFWNLKQLGGLTPPGAVALPVSCDAPARSAPTACAFAGPDEKSYVVHVVNLGARRPATVAGFPPAVTALHAYVTDARRGQHDLGLVVRDDGTAELTLDATSFTTVVAEASP